MGKKSPLMHSEDINGRKRFLAPSIVFLVTFLVYSVTLTNGFVHDDNYQVIANPWIKDVHYLWKIFSSPAWAFVGGGAVSNYYRPLMYIFYMADYYVFGLNAWGYHLVNVLIHSLNAVMVFLLISFLLNSPPYESEGTYRRGFFETILKSRHFAPSVAALLFALNPMNNEVVSWVAAVTEGSFALFVLAALYLYIVPFRRRRVTLFLSLIFFVLALMSKETAVVLLALVPAYDLSRSGWAFLRNWKIYLLYMGVAALYLYMRSLVLGGVVHHENVVFTPYELFLNIVPLIPRYLLKFMVPLNLSIIYIFHPVHSLTEPKVLGSLVFLCLYGVSVFLTIGKGAVNFSLLWILITLAPSLYLPVISPGGFAERYFYLPSVGFVMLIAIGLKCAVAALLAHGKERSTARAGAPASAIVLSIAAVLSIYAGGTVARSMVWKDDYTLWKDTVKKAPGDVHAQYNLAWAMHKRGELKGAALHYREALRIDPNKENAHYNLAMVYQNLGNIKGAIEHYEKALELNPKNETAHYNLGISYYNTGDAEKALRHFFAVIKLNPANADAHYNIGAIYEKAGRFRDAAAHFRVVTKLEPGSADAHYNLGLTLSELGRLDMAEAHLKKALELAPDFKEARRALERLRALKGKDSGKIPRTRQNR